jgi:CRP-like cAMP-binding protein
MTTRDPRGEFGDGETAASRNGGRASVSVLAELGGEAAEVASRSTSVALVQREVREVPKELDAGLIAVVEGFVLVSTDTCQRDGDCGAAVRRIVVATGQPGTLLLPPGPSERLEALTRCRLTIVSADSLLALLRLPPVAETIVIALAEALRESQATIRNCSHVHHSERVLEKLLQLARSYGRAVPGGVRIDFPLTHQLVADMVGSARETVSLALSDLARQGLVHRQRRGYVLAIGPDELFSTSAAAGRRTKAGAPPIDARRARSRLRPAGA